MHLKVQCFPFKHYISLIFTGPSVGESAHNPDVVPSDPSQTDSAKGKNAFQATWKQGVGQEEVDLELPDDEEEIQAGRESIKLREVSLGLKDKKEKTGDSSCSRFSVKKLLKE